MFYSKYKLKCSYKHIVVAALLARTGSIRKTNEMSHFRSKFTHMISTQQQVAENAIR
jgi:hypothetical protein